MKDRIARTIESRHLHAICVQLKLRGTRAKNMVWTSAVRTICFIQISCESLALELFFSPPTPNLSNLLIEASIYFCLYALNEELKGYPILLSDS
jgi:hypothetical protein